jgi:hypothetical protein
VISAVDWSGLLSRFSLSTPSGIFLSRRWPIVAGSTSRRPSMARTKPRLTPLKPLAARMSAVIQKNVPVTQTSPYASAIGDRSAGDDDSTPLQENLTANRAGDRRSTVPPLEPLAYRINDAIKVSGLGHSSTYKLIGEGKLRSIMIAGRRLIPADALRELFAGCRVT